MVGHRGLEPRTFSLRVCYSEPIELIPDYYCLADLYLIPNSLGRILFTSKYSTLLGASRTADTPVFHQSNEALESSSVIFSKRYGAG